MINKLSKIKKEIEKFEMENERSPSLNEVEQVHVPKVSSLNVLVNDDGDELGSLIEDDIFGRPDDITDKEHTLKKHLEKAMSSLSDREKDIVNCYFGIYGEPMTLEAIGDEFSLTKERIRQIKESAIRKIRNNVGDIFEYFG